MTLEASRGLHFYLRSLKVAVDDDIITDDEMAILSVLANSQGLPGGVLGQCWAILRGEIPSPITSDNAAQWEGRQMGDATTYQSALIAALSDEVITDDEWAMLDVMRRVMDIQPDEHALVEEAVRAMAAKHEGAESFTARLDRYLTLHPYR